MFNILTYGKKSDSKIGIPSVNNSEYGNTWKDHLSKYSIFKYVSLKKLQHNTKYVVFISFYHHFKDTNFSKPLYDFQDHIFDNVRYDTRRQQFFMPQRIKEDSKNNLVHWVIDYSTECDQIDKSSAMNFERLCELLHATPNNITLITGGETRSIFGKKTLKSAIAQGYNCITGHDLYNYLDLRPDASNDNDHNDYTTKKLKSIFNKSILPYKSLCYNRLPREHRTVIVAHIIKNGYDKKCLYSLGTFPNMERWHWIKQFPELADEINNLENGPEIYPHIKEEEVNLQVNQAHKLGWDHGLNSYFQLVTETTPNNNKIPFITEKSLKPFAMLQPFIQYGPQDNVKVLKMYGYDTFDKWINHSYDNEEDDFKRLRMVLKEFDRLQAISDKDWTIMLEEMLESLLHNHQLVKKMPIYDYTSQLIPILGKFVGDDNV